MANPKQKKGKGKNKAATPAQQGHGVPQTSNQMMEPGKNQPHNAKKEGLGPNTHR